MASDGRNIKVEALNERRLAAVKLRLAGSPIAEAAERSGLSQPTVISAVKAYQEGGWAAVPVGPRGRGIKKAPAPPSPPAQDIKLFSAPAVFQAPAAYQRAPRELSQTPAILGDPAALTHLQRLEAESIHIMREVVAESANPVMLYSIGKDSSVMLHLARKAFYPATPPFPLLHVDTTWKFREMYAFRDRMARGVRDGADRPREPRGARAWASTRSRTARPIHTDVMKTQALKQALDKHGFDAAFGGARRDEEKSRAKERVFSFRVRAAPLGPEEPAPGALAALQHAQAQGRIDPRLPAVELDRARRLAVHLPREHSRSCRSISPRSARWSSATAR